MELICLAHKECLSISAGLAVPREMVTNHQHVYLLCVHNCVCVCERKGESRIYLRVWKYLYFNFETLRNGRGFLQLSATLSSLFWFARLEQIFANNQTFSTPALHFIELSKHSRKFGCLCATCKCNYFLLLPALWQIEVTIMQL